MLEEFLGNIIKAMVDKPEEVKITEIDGETVCIFELRVAAGDYGKIIGRHGQNADAIRTLLNAAAAKCGRHAVLEILE